MNNFFSHQAKKIDFALFWKRYFGTEVSGKLSVSVLEIKVAIQ